MSEHPHVILNRYELRVVHQLNDLMVAMRKREPDPQEIKTIKAQLKQARQERDRVKEELGL